MLRRNTQLRQQGIEHLTDVMEVRMESQGQFGVIPRDGRRGRD